MLFCTKSFYSWVFQKCYHNQFISNFTFSPSSQGDWIVREEKKEIPVLKTLKGVRLPPYFCNIPFPFGACVKGI